MKTISHPSLGILTAATLTFTSLPPAPAPAADGERRRFIESLFRSVIESQVNPGQPVPHQHQPNSPVPQKPVPARPIPPNAAPNLIAYRNYLGHFSTQSGQLANHLSQSANVQGVRPLIPLALRLKSNCDVLVNHCNTGLHGFDALALQYRTIDADWRNLSHQLRTITGLDRQTRDTINQLDRYSAETCKLLNLTPQFDRNAVLRLCHMQIAYMDSLLDAIDYELHHEGECQNLLSRGRRLKDQLIRLEPVILNDPYDQVVARFSNYSTECRDYCAALYPLRQRSIERCLARVRAGNDSIFELLWIEPSLDRPYLEFITETMVHQLVSLFREMSVAEMVKLPPQKQQVILLAGNQLLGRCQNYCELIRRNAPLKDLVRDYSAINSGWSQLSPHFAHIHAETIVNMTRSIDGYCSEIRDILGVHSLYDHDRALSLAASLEDLSEHIYSLSSRYGRYCRSSQLQAQLGRFGNDFFVQARNLHQQVALGVSLPEIQAQCSQLLTTWEKYGPALDSMPKYGLSSTRFQYISALRQDINPVIAELAMMFGGF